MNASNSGVCVGGRKGEGRGGKKRGEDMCVYGDYGVCVEGVEREEGGEGVCVCMGVC